MAAKRRKSTRTRLERPRKTVSPGSFGKSSNARGLKQALADAAEARAHQTATADILKVIASSPSDVEPVFNSIAESVRRLLSDAEVGVALIRGDRIELVAAAGLNEERLGALRATFPRPLDLNSAVNITVVHGSTVHYADVNADDLPSYTRDTVRAAGIRAMLGVPLLRDGKSIGGVFVSRTTPGAYTEKQIELLRTFADQAVIAIENARLFNETKEALERQTATAEILKVIAGSPTDVQPVFEAIVENAARLMSPCSCGINMLEGGWIQFRAAAGTTSTPEQINRTRALFPIAYAPDENLVSRAIAEGRVIHVDTTASDAPAVAKAVFRATGARSITQIPLMRRGRGIGTITVRSDDSAFRLSDKQLALIKTFADQAVIAIENVRLFREIEDKSRQLEEASRHKSQFLASMSHELRTPLNAILGFNEMMLDGLCGEVPEAFADPLNEVQTSGKHLLRLINNVLDLAKIEAGRMELVLADYAVQDLVEGVRSTLRSLATEKGLEFVVTVPEDLPLAYGDSGRLTQCLINLAGNSLKFTKQGKVEVSVSQHEDLLVFRVVDTGIGIAPDKIGGLFTEFKQTDATIASEYGGSGLGLSIVKKFVEMHGGRIWAESELGKGSTFILEIPLRAQTGVA